MDKELVKDIIQWGVSNWSKLIPVWEKHLKNRKGKALAFGEREGGASLFLAFKGFQVTCTDYNDFPEDLPLEIHKKHKVTDLITYEKQDITATTYDDNTFDVVVFKSVIGALGSFVEQEKALKEIHRILKPGGILLFAENAKSSKLHQYARKKFTKWGHRWHYPSIDEFEILSSPFKILEFKTFGFFATFGRSEKQRNLLGKIDNRINFMTPKKWKYILVAALVK